MEVMTVINLKLVWASGARQQSRRREGERERGEEMERLRPGERKGKDKKREQKRIDWGGKTEKS